jgi:hypothetical protein
MVDINSAFNQGSLDILAVYILKGTHARDFVVHLLLNFFGII